jgi:hypothetical protein
MTTREVRAQLFLSPRATGYRLRKVFAGADRISHRLVRLDFGEHLSV